MKLLLTILILGSAQVINGRNMVKRTGIPAFDPVIQGLPFVGALAGNAAAAAATAAGTAGAGARIPNPAGQILSFITGGSLEPGTNLFESINNFFGGIPGSLCGRGSITLPSFNVDDLLKLATNGKGLDTLGPALAGLQGLIPFGGTVANVPTFLKTITDAFKTLIPTGRK